MMSNKIYNCRAYCKDCKSDVYHKRGDIYPTSEFRKRNCVVRCHKCNIYVPHDFCIREDICCSTEESCCNICPTQDVYNKCNPITNSYCKSVIEKSCLPKNPCCEKQCYDEKPCIAYGHVYNVATGTGQTVYGCTNPPNNGQSITFNNAPKLQNICFNGVDTLTLKQKGTYQAIYSVTAVPSIENSGTPELVSFKLIQTPCSGTTRTIPGSVFSTAMQTNGNTQLVGNVKFTGCPGDNIQLVNNNTSSINLASNGTAMPITIGNHSYNQNNVANPSIASTAINVSSGSSVYVAIQINNAIITGVTDSASNIYQLADKAVNGVNSVEIWYSDNVPAATNLIVTATFLSEGDIPAAIEVIEIKNAAISSLDSSAGAHGGSSIPTATVTTTNANDLGLMAVVVPSTNGSPTLTSTGTNSIIRATPNPSAGMTISGAALRQTFGPAGTYTMQANTSPTSNVEWAAVIVAIRSANPVNPVCEPYANASLNLIKLD